MNISSDSVTFILPRPPLRQVRNMGMGGRGRRAEYIGDGTRTLVKTVTYSVLLAKSDVLVGSARLRGDVLTLERLAETSKSGAMRI